VPRIQIFRVGTHRASNGSEITFGEAELRATASAYDPTKHEAPLVVGHPREDAPAYGWTRALHFTADGVLEVEPHQVDPQFAELVNGGKYKKISAAFYLPTSSRNPVPGTYYLKHVGFLGATPPAVRGLRSAQFAAVEEGVLQFEAAEAAEPQPQPQPDNGRQQPNDGAPASPAELAAREQRLAEREETLRRQEAELAAQRRLSELGAFCEPLVAAGRLLPRHREPLVAFLAGLPGDGAIEFTEHDGQKKKVGSLAWFKGFLQELPVQVHYGELAAAEEGREALQYAAPIGTEPASAADQELYLRAKRYQAEHKTDLITAVNAVRGGGQ